MSKMAAIAAVFSPAHRSEGETIATLALLGFSGLILSLLVLTRGVELGAEFY
jgi:hypothetical protein